MKQAEGHGEIHELLPWYVAGTLGPEESAAFREHLRECAACSEELATVEEVRGQLERHGRDWIEDHPTTDTLVAAARGEATDEAAAAVRRHLALCATCALETRWIRGETGGRAADEPDLSASRPRSDRLWIPVLAAAAGVVLGLLLPHGREPGDAPGLVVPHFVGATVRAGEEVTRVEVGPGEASVQLLYEVDFAPRSFPLVLEVRDARGNVIAREDRITTDRLLNDANVFYRLPKRLVPPGRYTTHITSSSAADTPLVFPFEVVEAPATPSRP